MPCPNCNASWVEALVIPENPSPACELRAVEDWTTEIIQKRKRWHLAVLAQAIHNTTKMRRDDWRGVIERREP